MTTHRPRTTLGYRINRVYVETKYYYHDPFLSSKTKRVEQSELYFEMAYLLQFTPTNPESREPTDTDLISKDKSSPRSHPFSTRFREWERTEFFSKMLCLDSSYFLRQQDGEDLSMTSGSDHLLTVLSGH